MFGCRKPKCGGDTKIIKTLRRGWRNLGTLRRSRCLKCAAEFETVEFLRESVEETIRKEAERRAREMFEAFKGVLAGPVTGDQKHPPVPSRFTSPRLPVYKGARRRT
jgi:transcriptional regulator NrdR family protein